MNKALIIGASVAYLGLLFFIAGAIERHLRKGRKLAGKSWIYALSLAVYCTGWTYYGSIGRAATHGFEFLTIYLGPLITCSLFVPVLQKILRICKQQRINSIADFISTRYGKSFSLGIVVTLGCIFGVIPYIALQLKAISDSFHIITAMPASAMESFWQDDSFFITVLLALFVIVFGTRSIDASERHEGLVGAIAFESVVKLIAFLAAGIFVTYGLFGGIGNLFERAQEAGLSQFSQLTPGASSYSTWLSMILVSMLAMILLPRQFQVAVVENTSERHLFRAIWLFPLYLLVINVFVMPIAMGGMLTFGNSAGADTYILSLPLQSGHYALGLLIYIGGFSAATGMIMVEAIALATMVSNHLVLPAILAGNTDNSRSFTKVVLYARRGSIIIILLLAYLFNRFIGPGFSLVSIGLTSMAAVAQLAPALIGGLYWKGASRKGALTGIILGFCIWFYTLIVPSAVAAGYLNNDLLEQGPWGLRFLRPQALFGLNDFSLLAHSVFWSLLVNGIGYLSVSVYSRQSAGERYGAEIFTGAFRTPEQIPVWKGNTRSSDVRAVMENFIGVERSGNLLQAYAQRHKIVLSQPEADPRIVAFAERMLSGVIGSASARFVMRNITKEEEIGLSEVLSIVRESQQVLELNKELKKKSIDLTRVTDALTLANNQLRQIDLLKDEFLYTVTHELRTPLTSIRAMSEIVCDHPDMEETQRQHYLESIVKETERLSHLITQVLNLERYESGRQKLQLTSVNLKGLLADVAAALQLLAQERGTRLSLVLPDAMFIIRCDREMIYQAVYNLVANALRFVPEQQGEVKIIVREGIADLQIWVEDNGKGIAPDLHELIFDKFFQARNQTLQKPVGSGLGLAICRRIVEMHQGKTWVESQPGEGARFAILLPVT
jgi:Na+/proline symporter/nitrogen-specific signal transduction histidine kinase